MLSSRHLSFKVFTQHASPLPSLPGPSSQASTPLTLSPSNSLCHLLDFPLPSPNLPATLPRHGKKPAPTRLSAVMRSIIRLSLLAAYVCGTGFTCWLLISMVQDMLGFGNPVESQSRIYGLAKDVTLPSPIVVTDKKGRMKWTVSIPSSLAFELKAELYADICAKSENIATQLEQSKSHRGNHDKKGISSYYHTDRSFIDVDVAEPQGLVPVTTNEWAETIWKPVVGWGTKRQSYYRSGDLKAMLGGIKGRICDRSLTYVMETSDAGFGKTLVGLWMSYGLAKKEGRAFFIDDSHWAYGNYLTFFQPPPLPPCLPPPPSHRLPCPHQAKHLIVSSSTTPWTFGRTFNDYFQYTHKLGARRQKPIFDLIRTGYKALFHLASPDEKHLESRLLDLQTNIRDKGGLVIGLHVRRGDRHPWEYQYQKSYIPFQTYIDAAQVMLDEAFPSPRYVSSSSSLIDAKASSRFLLASDDPDVYTAPEFSTAIRGQETIILASKAALDAAAGPETPFTPGTFVEENTGWEGGFFQDVFWNLGHPSSPPKTHKDIPGPKHLPTPENDQRQDPGELAMQLRELVGRAYILDLAVLSKSDHIVCGVSSTACRLLAVMMGWEKVARGKWKNVDGGFEWGWKEQGWLV